MRAAPEQQSRRGIARPAVVIVAVIVGWATALAYVAGYSGSRVAQVTPAVAAEVNEAVTHPAGFVPRTRPGGMHVGRPILQVGRRFEFPGFDVIDGSDLGHHANPCLPFPGLSIVKCTRAGFVPSDTGPDHC